MPYFPPAIVIQDDSGGVVNEYENRARYYKALGLEVRIEGQCRSACTFIATIPKKVCVGPQASLWFHEARSIPPAMTHEEGRWTMMRNYTRPLKEWITSRGGLTPDWLVLEGEELRRIVPPCKPA